MLGLVVNLDGSEDRWQKMREQFETLGLRVERVSAVDGRKMTPEELASHVVELNSFRKIGFPRELTPGEVGCFLSHRRCWQRLVDSGEKWAYILEDDVHISPRATEYLNGSHWIPSGIDLLHFGLEVQEKDVYRIGSDGALIQLQNNLEENAVFRQIKPSLIGAYGYLISAAAAAEALSLTKRLVEPVDEFLFSPYSAYGRRHKAWRMQIPIVCCNEDLQTTVGVRQRKVFRFSPLWIHRNPLRQCLKWWISFRRMGAKKEHIRFE